MLLRRGSSWTAKRFQERILRQRRRCGLSSLILWSGVQVAPSHDLPHDPTSRSRKLAGHRSGQHKTTKPAAGQVFVRFVLPVGIEPTSYPPQGYILSIERRELVRSKVGKQRFHTLSERRFRKLCLRERSGKCSIFYVFSTFLRFYTLRRRHVGRMIAT